MSEAVHGDERVGWFRTEQEGGDLVLAVGGAWTIATADRLDADLRRLSAGDAQAARFDLAALDALDTVGAWLLERTRVALASAGVGVTISGLKPQHAELLNRISEAGPPRPLPRTRHKSLLDVLERAGRATFYGLALSRDLLAFFGSVLITIVRVLGHPSRMRFTPLVSHIEQTGLNAMPIIGLLSFLIGIVLAYQGVDQLRRFGAEVYTVNLVGISILREMGILITAILVAGRSGSAFTAQIGTMQVNEEVDAMRTIGVDPIEALVLPRLLALLIALPLLTFFADIMGLLGGGFMSIVLVDLTFSQFVAQLKLAVTPTIFWVGMVKAPVFAFIIAMVGCFEGLRVSGSAESVGHLTTQSVVESIFLVIVFDAIFSIVFSYVGI